MTKVTQRTLIPGWKPKPKPPPKKRPPRDWGNYNAYQVHEKLAAMTLLYEIIQCLIIGDEWCGNGRPPYGMRDALFCSVVKVWNGDSSRRTISDLMIAKSMGYITAVPHFNTITNYMRTTEFTEYIEEIYRIIAYQFKDKEIYFAVDSTGFGKHNTQWLTARKNRNERKSANKLHVVMGVMTGVIAYAKVTAGTEHDSTHLPHMLRETCRFFRPQEVYGDSGYLSFSNVNAVRAIGAMPFFKPKKNTKLHDIRRWWIDGAAWDEMVTFFREDEPGFRRHYGRRNGVEGMFSSMKAKYLRFIRGKTSKSQENEVFTKVVCHNLSMLVRATFQLGLRVDFKNMPR